MAAPKSTSHSAVNAIVLRLSCFTFAMFTVRSSWRIRTQAIARAETVSPGGDTLRLGRTVRKDAVGRK